MKLEELDTPALFVDIDIMMANIREMHANLKKHHIKCRPHIKTHKVPALAHIQIREGAEGITCQKLGEAEVMVNAGIDDIFIAYNIIGKQKLERLSRLAKQAKIAVVADSEFVDKNLSVAMKTGKNSLKVFVECDIAKLRSGVRTPVQAAQLAKKINDLPGIEYEGLMQFKGGYPDIEFVKQTGSFFEETVDLLNDLILRSIPGLTKASVTLDQSKSLGGTNFISLYIFLTFFLIFSSSSHAKNNILLVKKYLIIDCPLTLNP